MDIQIKNEACSGDDFRARMRRLKIQESVLMANVKNSLVKCPDYKEYYEHGNELTFKKFYVHLKNSFIEIKNLFEDIRIKTNLQDSLDKIDIDDLKRDITQLESKIKSFKQYIRSELRTLQFEENVIKEKDIVSTVKERKIKRHNGVNLNQYNEIVTSPVRAIINSPFKCSEVQEFQAFMKSSQNKYGGWNEYNHNVFTKIWKKYFNDLLITSNNIEQTSTFDDFKNEVSAKIPDSNPNDIVSHGKWYSEYLRLKNRQEVALNRWKENKKKIKQPLRENNKFVMPDTICDLKNARSGQNLPRKDKNQASSSCDEQFRSTSFQTESRQCVLKNTKCRYMKPTQQWINRRDSATELGQQNYDVDNINKLQIPSWRLSLNKYN